MLIQRKACIPPLHFFHVGVCTQKFNNNVLAVRFKKPRPFLKDWLKGINLYQIYKQCSRKYISMFCRPITFLHYFKGGGGANNPVFYVLKSSVKTLLVQKNAYIVLGYIFNRGVMPLKLSLKKGPERN